MWGAREGAAAPWWEPTWSLKKSLWEVTLWKFVWGTHGTCTCSTHVACAAQAVQSTQEATNVSLKKGEDLGFGAWLACSLWNGNLLNKRSVPAPVQDYRWQPDLASLRMQGSRNNSLKSKVLCALPPPSHRLLKISIGFSYCLLLHWKDIIWFTNTHNVIYYIFTNLLYNKTILHKYDFQSSHHLLFINIYF